MKQIFCFVFACAALAAFPSMSTAQSLFFSGKKCTGSCLAGACAAGYELTSDSCNCNASCNCAGTVVCSKAGGGATQSPAPTCSDAGGACAYTALRLWEQSESDPIMQLSSLWGPRIAEGCSLIL